MSIGKIVQVIGAVVDIEFPRDEMPKVYDALVLEKDENKVSSAVWPLRLSDTALWFRLVRRPWAESWTF